MAGWACRTRPGCLFPRCGRLPHGRRTRQFAAILADIAAMSRVDAFPDSPSGSHPASAPGLPPASLLITLPPPAEPGALPAARAELELARATLVAPHAPLRFVAAQVLWALAPLAGLLGVDDVARWAAQLDAPRAEP